MGVIHLLCINGGVCLAAIIAYPFVMYVDGGWRWANLTFSLMPCVQLALHGYVLESPLWKQPAERDEAAVTEAEDDDLKPSWWDLREPLAVGATLAALQPLTGINIFTSYSTAIYKIAGLGDPIVGTIVGNVSLMACSCLAVLLVERMGRRDLLRMSCSIMTLSAVVVGVSLYSSTDEGDDATPETAYTTLLGAAGFLGGFSLGCGPVLWVLIAETFPTSRRSQALGGLNTLNAFVNLEFDPEKIKYEDVIRRVLDEAPREPAYSTQYRSAIFYHDDEQKRILERKVADMGAAAQYVAVEPYHVMYRAEEYHQQYLSKYGGGYTGGYGLM